jgi:hypothetical protein
MEVHMTHQIDDADAMQGQKIDAQAEQMTGEIDAPHQQSMLHGQELQNEHIKKCAQSGIRVRPLRPYAFEG